MHKRKEIENQEEITTNIFKMNKEEMEAKDVQHIVIERKFIQSLINDCENRINWILSDNESLQVNYEILSYLKNYCQELEKQSIDQLDTKHLSSIIVPFAHGHIQDTDPSFEIFRKLQQKGGDIVTLVFLFKKHCAKFTNPDLFDRLSWTQFALIEESLYSLSEQQITLIIKIFEDLEGFREKLKEFFHPNTAEAYRTFLSDFAGLIFIRPGLEFLLKENVQNPLWSLLSLKTFNSSPTDFAHVISLNLFCKTVTCLKEELLTTDNINLVMKKSIMQSQEMIGQIRQEHFTNKLYEAISKLDLNQDLLENFCALDLKYFDNLIFIIRNYKLDYSNLNFIITNPNYIENVFKAVLLITFIGLGNNENINSILKDLYLAEVLIRELEGKITMENRDTYFTQKDFDKILDIRKNITSTSELIVSLRHDNSSYIRELPKDLCKKLVIMGLFFPPSNAHQVTYATKVADEEYTKAETTQCLP